MATMCAGGGCFGSLILLEPNISPSFGLLRLLQPRAAQSSSNPLSVNKR